MIAKKSSGCHFRGGREKEYSIKRTRLMDRKYSGDVKFTVIRVVLCRLFSDCPLYLTEDGKEF